MLARCVEHAACLADRIVALDGAWMMFPDGTHESDPDQAQAIKDAAKEAGIECEVHGSMEVWPGQWSKRSHLFQLAARGQEVGVDWIFPVDTDWEWYADRDEVRAELAATRHDSLYVPFYTPPPPLGVNLMEVAADAWHVGLSDQTMLLAMLWRMMREPKVEAKHWFFSALDSDGQRVGLWDSCEGRYPLAKMGQLDSFVRVDHMCFTRHPKTVADNKAYCMQRAAYVATHGVEP